MAPRPFARNPTASDLLAAKLLAADTRPDLLAEETLTEAARNAIMSDPYLLVQIAQGWALLGIRDQLERLADISDGE